MGVGAGEKRQYLNSTKAKLPFSLYLEVSTNAVVVVIDAFTSNKDPSPAAEL